MFRDLFYTTLLGILPISEVRGAIPIGLAFNLPIYTVLLFAVLANFLVVPITFIFLDYLHKHLIKINSYNKLFNKFVKRTRSRIEHKIGTSTEFLALYLLVAIPLPFTGAYTGTLAAWLFNLNRKKSIFYIFLGILTAATIVTLLSLGVLSFLK